VGAGGEIALIAAGAFEYLRPDATGEPLWPPGLYLAGAPVLGQRARGAFASGDDASGDDAPGRGPRAEGPAEPTRKGLTMTNDDVSLEGGCTCRAVRYRLTSRPMIVHCCHCRWCQRETGASFALNAMIEADRVARSSGAPEAVLTPSLSGKGQTIWRCPSCRVAVYSNYPGAGPDVHFVRVGTLDDPDLLPPDVHIYTSSKQPWVTLPEGARAFAEYYDRSQIWSAASLARRAAVLARSGRALSRARPAAGPKEERELARRRRIDAECAGGAFCECAPEITL
jgi:hypothetical protein